MENRKTDDERWSEFLQLLVDSLDVQDFLQGYGIRFTGSLNSKGWAECHAWGREDANPSAAVNLSTGYYKDLGAGPSFAFFQLLVHIGAYSTFRMAVENVAKKLGLKSRMPKSRKGLSFWAKLKFLREWRPQFCRALCAELGIGVDVLELLGSQLANTHSGDLAVCMPVYCPTNMVDGEQVGFVLKNANGGTLLHDKGTGAKPERLKNKSLGRGGMLNRYALRSWADAEVVIKVEGISDMLVLQDRIPEEYRGRYAVTTNSDGADAVQTAWSFAHNFEGKQVVIIHDCDEPGQFGEGSDKKGGAQRWIDAAMSGGCQWVTNLVLPYEIQPKKGKDVRDWFADGGTWNDLLLLIDASPKQTPQQLKPEDDLSSLKPHQQILRQLNLMVIGHRKSGAVEVFNAAAMRRFTITDIDRLSYNKMLIHIGDEAKRTIHCAIDGECPAGKIPDIEVRRAIAEEAGGKEISRANTIGVGMWEYSGRLVAVGAGEWLAVNGGVTAYQTPTVEGQIVDFGEAEESWYDRELLDEYLPKAKSPQWREEHFRELEEIFGRWGNHQHPQAETLLASLCLCSWAQQIWPLRPWVGIQGESSSGKTVLGNFLGRYFGPLGIATSNTSEAGLRAAVRNASRILLLDEFEASREREKIIALLMGSSRRGAASANLRATSRQEVVKGGIEAIPWMFAVELQADKQTERNRYLMFEMSSRDGLPWFQIPDAEDCHILRNKSIAVVMATWQRALELYEIITKAGEREYSRVGESYATCVAMYGAAIGMSDERAVSYHSTLLDAVSEVVEESRQSDQEIALEAILSAVVMIEGGQRKSIAELLNDPRGTSEEHLNRIGIRRFGAEESKSLSGWAGQEGGHVFFNVAATGQLRRTILRDTQQSGRNLSAILQRLPGAFKSACRVSGRVLRGVIIPQKIVNGTDPEKLTEVQLDSDLSGV